MNTTHDDDDSPEEGEWVYHEPDERDTTESEDIRETDPTGPRIAVSKYLPRIEYDSEDKSVSITTRL